MHIGHRCAAVDVGAVVQALLNHAEDAERRRMIGDAGGDQRIGHVHPVAVEMQFLLIDGNDDLQRPFRNMPEWLLAGMLGLPLKLCLDVAVGRIRCAASAGSAAATLKANAAAKTARLRRRRAGCAEPCRA